MPKQITLQKIYSEHVLTKDLGGEFVVCYQTTPLRKFIRRQLVHFGVKFGFIKSTPLKETSVEWKSVSVPTDQLAAIREAIYFLTDYYQIKSADELVILWGSDDFITFQATNKNYVNFMISAPDGRGEPRRMAFDVEIVCVPYLSGPPLVLRRRDAHAVADVRHMRVTSGGASCVFPLDH
jgi:hypothetical protein